MGIQTFLATAISTLVSLKVVESKSLANYGKISDSTTQEGSEFAQIMTATLKLACLITLIVIAYRVPTKNFDSLTKA